MSQQDYEQLRQFLEEREVSARASKPLKDGTTVRIVITGDADPYYIIRENKRTCARKGHPPNDPHLTFTVSPKAIERLANFQSQDIGEFGVEFFRIMVSKNQEEVLSVHLHTGFFGLTRLGFFGILALGGPAVMSFLARQGFSSIKQIGKAISKARGKED